MKTEDYELGQKVLYTAPGKTEKGIVKSHGGYGFCFVVFNCNEDWFNYSQYTGCRTPVESLTLGWNDDSDINEFQPSFEDTEDEDEDMDDDDEWWDRMAEEQDEINSNWDPED